MIRTVISIMKEKNDKITVPGIQGDLMFTEETKSLHELLLVVFEGDYIT